MGKRRGGGAKLAMPAPSSEAEARGRYEAAKLAYEEADAVFRHADAAKERALRLSSSLQIQLNDLEEERARVTHPEEKIAIQEEQAALMERYMAAREAAHHALQEAINRLNERDVAQERMERAQYILQHHQGGVGYRVVYGGGMGTAMRLTRFFDVADSSTAVPMLARLIGAQPGDKLTLSIPSPEGPAGIRTESNLQVLISGEHANAGLLLGRTEEDSPAGPAGSIVAWDIGLRTFGSEAEGAQASQRTGEVGRSAATGYEVLRAMQALSQGGVTRAYFQAAKGEGGVHRGWNGYRTWPKLGATGPIPDVKVMNPDPHGEDDTTIRLNELVARRFGERVTTVEQLWAQPGGPQFWAQFGEPFNATFDLTPGSATMQYVNMLLGRRGVSG